MANVGGRPRQGAPYVLSKGGGVLSKGGGGSTGGDRPVGGDRAAGRDELAGGGGPAGRERPGGRQRWRGGRGPLAFLRRAVLAGLAALVALGGGILLAYGWQALGGPHASGSSGTPAAAVPSAPPEVAPGTPTDAAGATGVPAGWVPVGEDGGRLRFAHPSGWRRRADRLVVFFARPTADGGPGIEEVGAARLPRSGPRQALLTLAAGELRGLTGYRQVRLGPVADPAGRPAAELVATYLRRGERARFVLRAVETPTATYVAVARAADADGGRAEALLQQVAATLVI